MDFAGAAGVLFVGSLTTLLSMLVFCKQNDVTWMTALGFGITIKLIKGRDNIRREDRWEDTADVALEFSYEVST